VNREHTRASDEPGPGGSEAELLFGALVRDASDEYVPDVELLCAARPDLAQELRTILAQYRRARQAMHMLKGAAGEAEATVGGPGEEADDNSDDGPGRYTIRREIARGGMGTILEVWDEELRRPLAMKVLREQGAGAGLDGALAQLGSGRRKSRLLNEAQILGQLDHPGIVPVHEVGRNASGELFFTMQLVRGRELAEIIQLVAHEQEGWNLPRAVGVIQRVCEAVAYAHEQGVVHRDLKPQNVMVGEFGETYVMDWGLAKARGRNDAVDIRLRKMRIEPASKEAPSLEEASASRRSVRTDRRDASDEDSLFALRTYEGDVVGTPAYMSPEQAEGLVEAVDERSDVYGVGAILYHLLAGRMPYAEHTKSAPHELLAVVQAGPPPPLSSLAGYAPAELRAICAKAMARDREERYTDIQAMANDLRAWLEGRVVRAHRTGLWAEVSKWSGRHRAIVSLLSVLVVVLLASGITLGVLYRQSEGRREAAVLAQADSLRRQSALFPQAPGGGFLPSFTEEFDRDQLDRRWVITHRPNDVEVRDGALRLTSSSAFRTEVALDRHVNVIEGDFDFELDYSLENFNVHPIPRSERQAGMALISLGRDGRQLMQICRHAEYRSGVNPDLEQTCRAMDVDLRLEFVEDTGNTGRMRLSRRGDRITASTWREGWHELLSGSYTDDKLTIIFFCGDFYFDDPSVFAVERFDVRTFHRPPGDTLLSIRDDFSTGIIAPELRIHADAGIAAVLDGELQMEKLAGRTGYVMLRLDESLDHVLRGDFDVSFRFDLLRFPVPDEGRAELILETTTPDYAGFGNVRVLAEKGGLVIDSRYHAGEARVDLPHRKGGLRLQRRGNSILAMYWDDGWHELLERPEINGELDIVFTIKLRSTSEEAYVVALDELVANSGNEGEPEDEPGDVPGQR